jgi:hypothetical protein
MAWAFVFVLAYFSRTYPSWPGTVLCFIGATIRFWASGYLRKDQRPAVGGPYAHVRNPLYLGTYLMAVGVIWSIENYALLAFVTVTFAAVYHYIILDEETKLARIFGDSYAQYCGLVPRFFPRPFPARTKALAQVNPEPSHRAYSWELSMKNRAYEAYLSFIGLIGFAALCAYVWARFSS